MLVSFIRMWTKNPRQQFRFEDFPLFLSFQALSKGKLEHTYMCDRIRKKSDLHKVNLRQYRVNSTYTGIIASSRCLLLLRMTQLFSSFSNVRFQLEAVFWLFFLAWNFFPLSLLLVDVDIWQEISFALNPCLHHCYHRFLYTSALSNNFMTFTLQLYICYDDSFTFDIRSFVESLHTYAISFHWILSSRFFLNTCH